ncbi:hypothetical protein BDW74DRAFT_887 [Aspergillus multicolor]|uniref:uncharacterized protein n=1 Tax=Aspergillus multicolor TaxID=41759 RepID=UPI003CCD22A8
MDISIMTTFGPTVDLKVLINSSRPKQAGSSTMRLRIKKGLAFFGILTRRRGYERLTFQEELNSSLLLELPLEILLLIIPHLPLVSQACLALTCKPLYRLLRSAHGNEQLAWPRYLAYPLPSCKQFGMGSLRNELLLKLEDARWLYCRGRLKLHPKECFKFAVHHTILRPILR